MLIGAALCWPGWCHTARADPVLTVLHGAEPDGSPRFIEDLAQLWRWSNLADNARLAGAVVSQPRARLAALRRQQGQFAIVDAASLFSWKGDFPDLVAVATLWPLALHVFSKGAESEPLKGPPPGALLLSESASFAQPLLTGGMTDAGGDALRSIPTAQVPQHLLNTPGWLAVAAPVPTLEIAQALEKEPSLHLMGFAQPFMEQMQTGRPWLVSLTLRRGTYPGLSAPLQVPATPLVLVSLASLPADIVLRMLDCVYRHREFVTQADALFGQIDSKANADLARWLPFHAVAVRQFGLPTP